MKYLENQSFLAGGGEMGERTRAMDWSRTPVGPVAEWPLSLKAAVSICLGSRHPMVVWWGNPAYTQFYNDAYISFLGEEKHPGCLGQSASTCWREIWPTIGPMLESVYQTGEATWSEDLPLVLRRNLSHEEGYFTFSYSPIRNEDGSIGGIFCACNETTQRVLGERRLRTLGDLHRMSAEARTVEGACEIAARMLNGNPHDIPFALIYLLGKDPREAQLLSASAMEKGCLAAPAYIDLDQTEGPAWPLRQVLESGSPQLVRGLMDRFGPLPGGPWPEPSDAALVVPIAAPGQTRATGFLVCGLSPRRVVDAEYMNFINVVGGHIGTAIANARAYDEERKRAEALAEIDRAKTLFFSNISHEFRTPLTLILGPLADALASPDLPSGERERLETAQRNSLRLLKLVNSLLDFSRIEAGRVQASYQPTDLAGLTRDLASNFRSACEKAGLRFAIHTAPLEEPAYVDRDMWEKIVLNLLSNAFKFTFEGEIAVTLRRVDGHAELSVADSGVGIPAHELPRLFERFHRIEGQKSRTYEGSGIGLALVQELVKLHDGTIRVHSTEGEGTCFTVSLPLGSSHLPQERIGAARTVASSSIRAESYVEEALRWLPDAAAAPSTGIIASGATPATQSDLASVRVLLVDDNADMRAYVAQLLRGHCRVETAADGQEALAVIRERRPDLVLTDVMMPRMDGLGLLRAIRHDPDVADLPVIFVSARAGEEAEVEGLSAGADDYLTKPFTARELIARVGATLRLAKLREQAAVDLQDTRLLHQIAQGYVRAGHSVSECLEDMLNAAIKITKADKGNVQLLDESSGSLSLTVQRGFEQPFLDYFAIVHRGDPSVCGASMQTTSQIVVEDVAQSDIFAGQESLRVLLDAGVRAVQSTPLVSSTGNVLGMVSTHFTAPHRPSERQLRFIELLARQAADYLERDRATAALQCRTDQFRTLLNQAPLGVYLVDSRLRIREVNPTALSVFGDIKGGVVGRSFDEIIHILWEKKYADEIVAIFRRTLATGEPYTTPHRAEFRADRSVTEHYEWRVDRLTLPDGSFGVVCYFRDVSEQVQAETTRQLLLRELNHRVKNTLANVQAIAQRTLRTTNDPADFAIRFSGRIQALARVHALLTDATWHGADLHDLIRDQLLQGTVDEARLTVQGPAVHVAPQMAVHIALMLHELGTNSSKYGALSTPKGWVRVHWSVTGSILRLQWCERGGPMVTAPTRRGFGTVLIEQSAKSEGGDAELVIEPEGLTWNVQMTLPASGARTERLLPEKTPVPSEDAARRLKPAKLSGLRLLVIEDESLIALDLMDRLEKAGADVQAVSTEKEALRAIEDGVFEGALLDANLHGRSVAPVAAALTSRKIPFVFVTGYGADGLPTSFKHVSVLAKPVSDEEIFAAIARITTTPAGVVRLNA
jgi:PAS domain S-box-containing protein